MPGEGLLVIRINDRLNGIGNASGDGSDKIVGDFGSLDLVNTQLRNHSGLAAPI